MSAIVHHEWDEDGNCALNVTDTTPNWKFSWWDMLGIAATTAAGIVGSVSQGLNLLSREFAAAAEHSREAYNNQIEWENQQRERAEMAEELEQIIYGPEDLT